MNYVVMIKWGAGYPADEFNRTYRAALDHAPQDTKVLCLTDDPTGLDAGIEIATLPEIPLERSKWNRGMWPKLAMFKPDALPKGAKILYVDVDIAAVGDLSVLFDMIVPEKVQIIRDWKTYHEQWFPKLFPSNRTGNSSVLGFVAGENTDIWDRFVADPEGSFETLTNDQIFISEVAKSVDYLPEGLVGSFKKTVAPLPPLAWFSECRPAKECAIVAFHGKPGLDDLTLRNRSYLALLAEGFGRVQWIEDYLDKYDAS